MVFKEKYVPDFRFKEILHRDGSFKIEESEGV